MKTDQQQKAVEAERLAEAKAVEEAQAKAEEEVRERLLNLKNFLIKQSLFNGDKQSWAAGCIQSFLDGKDKTLDHAFGLRSSKTGRKPMQTGKDDDWIYEAWKMVNIAAPDDTVWPDTKTMAKIGRFYGLGGKDSVNAEDHGIASDLKRRLKRYHSIIMNQASNELIAMLKEDQ